jgi:hypothetical protein
LQQGHDRRWQVSRLSSSEASDGLGGEHVEQTAQASHQRDLAGTTILVRYLCYIQESKTINRAMSRIVIFSTMTIPSCL